MDTRVVDPLNERDYFPRVKLNRTSTLKPAYATESSQRTTFTLTPSMRFKALVKAYTTKRCAPIFVRTSKALLVIIV